MRIDILKIVRDDLASHSDRVDGLSTILHTYQRLVYEFGDLFDDIEEEKLRLRDAWKLCGHLREARNRAEKSYPRRLVCPRCEQKTLFQGQDVCMFCSIELGIKDEEREVMA